MGRAHKALIIGSQVVFLLATTTMMVLPRITPMPQRVAAIVSRDLIIPVDGVAAKDLVDSWGAVRSGGRRHEGIDIMARAGTPVRAAAAGSIAKLFRSAKGGLTLYEFDRSGRVIFYYAHLQAYAAGLSAGQEVGQGQLIAYVGSTGNATAPHLHFEIQRPVAAGQWWRGAAFDPYVPLKTARLN